MENLWTESAIRMLYASTKGRSFMPKYGANGLISPEIEQLEHMGYLKIGTRDPETGKYHRYWTQAARAAITGRFR